MSPWRIVGTATEHDEPCGYNHTNKMIPWLTVGTATPTRSHDLLWVQPHQHDPMTYCGYSNTNKIPWLIVWAQPHQHDDPMTYCGYSNTNTIPWLIVWVQPHQHDDPMTYCGYSHTNTMIPQPCLSLWSKDDCLKILADFFTFYFLCFLEFGRRNVWEPLNEHDVSVRSSLRPSEDSKKSQHKQGT